MANVRAGPPASLDDILVTIVIIYLQVTNCRYICMIVIGFLDLAQMLIGLQKRRHRKAVGMAAGLPGRLVHRGTWRSERDCYTVDAGWDGFIVMIGGSTVQLS